MNVGKPVKNESEVYFFFLLTTALTALYSSRGDSDFSGVAQRFGEKQPASTGVPPRCSPSSPDTLRRSNIVAFVPLPPIIAHEKYGGCTFSEARATSSGKSGEREKHPAKGGKICSFCEASGMKSGLLGSRVSSRVA